MNTVQSAWDRYKSQVMISDVNEVHLNDIETGFHAGSAVMLSTIIELFNSDMSAQAKGAVLNGLQEELVLYGLKVLQR